MNNLNPQVLSSDSNVFITFLASILIWLLYAGLLAVWIFNGKVRKEVVLQAFMISAVTWVICKMIKDLMPVIRPFSINGNPPLTLTTPFDGSYPSVHTACAFSLAVWVFIKNKKIGTPFLIGAILVAIGRVVSNVHYPMDAVAGAILGIFVALLLDTLAIGFGKRIGRRS